MERDEQEAWDLLPWYVTGAIDAEERRQVERALERSPSLRQELESQRRLASVIASLDERDTQVDQSLAQMRGRIRQARKPGLLERLRGGLDQLQQRSWRLALPAAALASLLLAVFVLQPTAPDGPYTTLTSEEAPDPAGPLLRVQPQTDADAAAFEALVAAQGLRIIEGPSAGGVYTLAGGPDSDLTAAALALRNSPLVGFVSESQP